MITSKIHTSIRPLPHYTCTVDQWERDLATALRAEFRPKISRRLPGHYTRGFKAGEIVQTVARHKAKYPYYVRIDIAKFYPSIRHQDIVVGAQIAYRDLLSLDFVPKKFKECYVGAINKWCRQLPLRRGIPIGSGLSEILSAVMLVPLWLEYKRRFETPFIVFVDDVLFFAGNEQQANEIYVFIENRLHDEYDLQLNVTKSCAGRFSKQSVTFCGWEFKGGYAVIDQVKLERFCDSVTNELKRSLHCDARTLLKRINRKIDGFANYYKHGDVGRQFDLLDKFVRSRCRVALRSYGVITRGSNTHLREVRLHSLTHSRTQLAQRGKTKAKKIKQPTPPRSLMLAAEAAASARVEQKLETINSNLNQMVSMLRQVVRALERFSTI